MSINSTQPARELIAVCDACREPVDGGDGYLHVSHAEIFAYEKARTEWEKANPPGQVMNLSDLLDHPSPARWKVHHRRCDPDPESSDYWIDVAQVSTWQGLIARTAHLLEKSWFAATDWQGLLQGVAHGHRNGVGRLNQVA